MLFWFKFEIIHSNKTQFYVWRPVFYFELFFIHFYPTPTLQQHPFITTWRYNRARLYIITPRRQKAELLNIEIGGIYSDHWAVRG
jgi:hypothetical protein